ncbi:Histone deacetylase complex subunit [Emydomyces testavorans]|uniref:Histone deacetylase complex subunit n=1 Tax=Emydomyces testavorans TaxID=2070801 RepID=A0AAF0DE04_9EURO|nr:Histone deacetylase complex subunit [Emydomyces testavorans]
MTPRRSSRARGSQAPPSAIHSNSSSSLNSLGRIERNTRSNNKLSSPRRSSTHLSQSVDDADARSRHDPPQTRQRQRGRDNDENDPVPITNDEYDDEDGDEEEITRCICGQQDYPGLPPSSRETIGRSSLKAGIKEESNQDPSAAASEILSEDAGSLFIQCDSCKVWQHGGCVGIMEEALSPDEYFCEKCRKDLHKMTVSGNGIKQTAKRQRTGSPSPSSIASKQAQPQSQSVSEDEKSKTDANGNKKVRSSVTRNQRDKEAPSSGKDLEKEVVGEITGRRKGRSERSKGDDSEPETASPSKNTVNGSVAPQSAPETPDIPPPLAQKSSTRKSGRPARRGRVGRNQYTRDRETVNGNGTDNQTNSPRRGQSRDENGDSPPGNGGANGVHINGGESGKPSRPRYMNPNRTTMNDMRRRVAAILEFISRMQVEMATTGEQTTPPNGAGSNGGRAPNGSTIVAALEGAVVNGDIPASLLTENARTTQESGPPKEREFKDLSSVEMMDELTRGLLKWQQEFGKYGEK